MNAQTSSTARGWYTARELAGLPGMPGTVQGVNARAKAQKWNAKKRMGRGGGYAYSLASLPLETQLALLDKASRLALAESAKGLRELADRHQAMADQFHRYASAMHVAAREEQS